MKFSEILRGVETVSRTGDAEVAGVQYDSRKIGAGDLFVAMRGETTDGNRYIDAAIKQGAMAVVTDSTAEPRAGIAWANVAHGRKALAGISENFYGRPAQTLKIVGVTGTNGKTTTTFLLDSLLRNLGAPPPVLIGTIEYHVAGKILPSPHTTPESLELNRMFAEATNEKLGGKRAQHAVMEVSSHALEQGRVWGIPFEAAVFTNLTRDHLDYHGDMQKYSAAKQMLFEGAGAKPPKFAVINTDDEFGRNLAELSRSRGSSVTTLSIQSGADLLAESIQLTPQGTRFAVRTRSEKFDVSSPLIGKVNVYNLLAAMGAARALGYGWTEIVKAAASSKGVPGRFEKVSIGGEQSFTVVIDYAHTDDALRNLTAAAREFVNGKGRVLTLFGCGGDRDRAKRPLMGQAAGEGSDFVVLTSDNPRSEDPLAIMQDALNGLKQTGTHHVMEADRRRAIAIAIDAAKPGDIVLIAGKGHEKTQTTREGVFPFDDVEQARRALEQRFTKVMERAQ